MLALPKELTHAQATDCLRDLVAGLRTSTVDVIALDATPLERFDSSALAVLLACQRAGREHGKNVMIHGMPGHLHDLAQLYGIAELLPTSALNSPLATAA